MPMTGGELMDWRKRQTPPLTKGRAAALLGIGRSTFDQYESGIRRDGKGGVVIPRAIALACAAIENGLRPCGSEPAEPGDSADLIEPGRNVVAY